jgi:hypothetical protein
MHTPYFKELDEVCQCTECKKEFKAYDYWEDCRNCNDGKTWDGEECMGCGGTGTHESVVKDMCQDCLYLYLTKED